MLDNVLHDGFRLALHRRRFIFFDLLWKAIWLACTVGALLLVAGWFLSELRAIGWSDTGNRAVNAAFGFALLRQFWDANRTEILGAVATVLLLSLIIWFVLEAAFRARIFSADASPQLKTVEPRQGLGWRGVVQDNTSFNQHHPSASRPPSSSGVGNLAFSIFLLSNLVKCLFITAAAFSLAAICCGRYMQTPLSGWPQIWQETRGAAIVAFVTLAALGFLLTILETLIRSDAIELLGTDLFRVVGLIGILVLFEAMISGSCVALVAVGFLKIAGWQNALIMMGTAAVAVVLMNVFHSYLLVVRFSAVDIMRQDVVEI